MNKTVTDAHGAIYHLGVCLGEGGQGSVYQLKEGRLAVKLLRKDARMDAETLRRRLERVRRLDLTGLPLARPLSVLRPPQVGYVMELLQNTESLGSLIRPPADCDSASGWYMKSGGLRGRMRVLARLAGVMNRIHGRGLAYGDLSPENVRFSGDPCADFELHLIDCDNLRIESAPDTSALYTPGYAAPELISGKSGVNTLSDLHAFSVLAFECLTGVHPFLGDQVMEGEPEMEELAFAGELPWIEDPDDQSNVTKRGVPRDNVLSKETRRLFTQSFGPGRTDAGARPRFSEWQEVLAQAADMTLHCGNPGCHASYFLNPKTRRCPWCERADSPSVTIHTLLWNPSCEPTERFGRLVLSPDRQQPRVVGALRLTEGMEAFLEPRHISQSTGEDTRPLAKLLYRKLEGPEANPAYVCALTNLADHPLRIVRRGGDQPTQPPSRIVTPQGEVRIVIADSKQPDSRVYLHAGEMDHLHRVFRFGGKP